MDTKKALSLITPSMVLATGWLLLNMVLLVNYTNDEVHNSIYLKVILISIYSSTPVGVLSGVFSFVLIKKYSDRWPRVKWSSHIICGSYVLVLALLYFIEIIFDIRH